MAKEKQIATLLDQISLDDSFILGYYGGGNFGDELLFEVLQHTFLERGYKKVSFLYQKPREFSLFHKSLGYEPVDSGDKLGIIKTIWRRKSIVIGGGGLWGLDINLNVVLMSVMLFFARYFMGKEVYLLGVGYYGSTNRMGHFAAWLAGKSATQILARDQESYERFASIHTETYLCDDIAFRLPELGHVELSNEAKIVEDQLGPISEPTTFISVRRFKPTQTNSYQKAIEDWLTSHPDQPVILGLMEPRRVDPEGYRLLRNWQRKHHNMKVIDFDYNPIALYRFFSRYREYLRYIGPQFHVLLVAHLAGVKILPIAYDNKVMALFEKLRYSDPIPIREVSERHILQFIEEER